MPNWNESKATKITFWDKIFSFSSTTIEKYLKEAIWDYYDQIDKSRDFIRRDYLFLIKTTWYVFVMFILFIWFVFYAISLYLKFSETLKAEWFNLFVFSSSILIFIFFVYFWIKARFINAFSIVTSIFFIWIEIYLIRDAILTIDWITHFVFTTAFIVFAIFLLETSFNFIKVIYNRFVDYKNDFIVIYPKWIYYSDKNWVLDHVHTRVEFDKITNIEAKQVWFLWSLFNYWTLKISTMWAIEDIIFDHCADFDKASKRLDDMRLDYISKKEKWEIWYLEIKPFESSIRDRIMEILS